MGKKQGELVAKYVERKMSPTTGQDTDYVYEWALVKNSDPNEIYKGGKYGIYRSLTVNGEVRYDDLMGFGDTPTEAAHSTPVETVLDKAKKFGVMKTKFDKEIAEQRAKQEAKERAEQEEQLDNARFEATFSPLRTLRGVKETTIKIATWPEWVKKEGGEGYHKPSVMQEVKGYNIGYGVGVAAKGEGKHKTYTVTHLNSGLAFGPEWKDRKEAIALARAEGMLADWSQYPTEKDVPKVVMDKAAALVRATVGQRLDKKLAGDLDRGIEKQFAKTYRESMTFGRPKEDVLKDAETAVAELTPRAVNRDLAGLFKDGRKDRPNLNNTVGLHPSYGSWANFLKDAELREEKNGTRHYISSNGHYIVLPDGEVITFYGYHGQNAFDRLVEDREGWLAEREKAEREIDELLHPNLPKTATELGLTPSQLAQAEKEGVTTIAGLRRIEKNTRGEELEEQPRSADENAAIHAWYDEHPGEDKLSPKRKRKLRRAKSKRQGHVSLRTMR